jgi:hypothetical protein
VDTLKEEQISEQLIRDLAVDHFLFHLQCDLRRPIHGDAYSDRVEALFVRRKAKACAVGSDSENEGGTDEALSVDQNVGESSARLLSSIATGSIACAVSITREPA